MRDHWSIEGSSDIPAVVETAKAPAPLGPYSQGIVHGGVLYCAGQIGIDPATGKLAVGGVEAQARQCLDNLGAVCEAAGTSLVRALRIGLYVTDLGQMPAVNAAYAEAIGELPPARTGMAVAGLPKGAAIEVDAIVAL